MKVSALERLVLSTSSRSSSRTTTSELQNMGGKGFNIHQFEGLKWMLCTSSRSSSRTTISNLHADNLCSCRADGAARLCGLRCARIVLRCARIVLQQPAQQPIRAAMPKCEAARSTMFTCSAVREAWQRLRAAHRLARMSSCSAANRRGLESTKHRVPRRAPPEPSSGAPQ